ncbi:serine protease [uncultured Kordia sp.]|uniref:trypsin-like serine peptidase n=1 Tax=uncultured Kordia sp. TaxID=507699 RepID=UPI00260DCE32|nr:serine protease [uncultured Kordia sp.]
MNIDEIIKKEKLKNTPFSILLSLKDKFDDNEILDEICNHFEFGSQDLFFESLKKFLIRYGESLSLGNGQAMADQIKRNNKKAEESIIMTWGRPAFIVRDNKINFPLNFDNVWQQRFKKFEHNVCNAIPNVGRIEIKKHPNSNWIGTGWLIKGSNIIVTNRHVAQKFASLQSNLSFGINRNYRGEELEVFIDFKEEHLPKDLKQFDSINSEIFTFKITRIIHINENDEPDLALLEVSNNNPYGKKLPIGLEIANYHSNAKDTVFVIGYPAYTDENQVKIYDFIFKDIYNVKRLSPGEIYPSSAAEYIYEHECSTWYGNSGSPIIDLHTGKVVGIHYAGANQELNRIKSNWAVRSTYLIELLQELKIFF